MHALAIRDLINVHFSETLDVIGFYQEEPLLEVGGAVELISALHDMSTQHIDRLRLSNKPNEPHAIVASLDDLPRKPLRITLQTLDFSHICALRETGMRPAILSASAVLVCQDTEELIVHHRAPDVATHPNCLHIFGGAFDPVLDISANHASLKLTIQRELHEETGLQLSLPDTPQLILTREKTSGFIQLCMLGVPVRAAQLCDLQDNWEGRIYRVAFSELAELLTEPNWVASGKAHILSWLALGAPHTEPSQKFGPYSARQLFELLIDVHQQM